MLVNCVIGVQCLPVSEEVTTNFIYLLFLSLVPGQVTAVTLTRTVTNNQPSLNVSWTVPQSDRTIQHYQVDYRVSGGTTWSTVSPNPTSTSTTLENLQLGTTYEVRVRALSDIGNGTWSDTSSETTVNGKINPHKS